MCNSVLVRKDMWYLRRGSFFFFDSTYCTHGGCVCVCVWGGSWWCLIKTMFPELLTKLDCFRKASCIYILLCNVCWIRQMTSNYPRALQTCRSLKSARSDWTLMPTLVWMCEVDLCATALPVTPNNPAVHKTGRCSGCRFHTLLADQYSVWRAWRND